MTPKKRRVDRNAVKYSLSIGKYPGEIAKEWGVTRQYISSIRQDLVKKGILQRGKPGRPKRLQPTEEATDLELKEIERFFNRIKLMKIQMMQLEMDREHYKSVYEYVFNKLCEHISEEEKREVMAMTGHEYIGRSPKINLENYEQAAQFISSKIGRK